MLPPGVVTGPLRVLLRYRNCVRLEDDEEEEEEEEEEELRGRVGLETCARSMLMRWSSTANDKNRR